MNRIVIGLCGPAKSGKSLAAEYLVNNHGFERVKFAGPLKAMLVALGLNYDEVEGPYKERPSPLLGGKTPRHAMITLGTEWGRELIDPDLWINAWRAAVDRLPADQNVVVDDCRFANEAATIHTLGGHLIRIDRRAAGIGIAHVSETANFMPDASLQNNGTLEQFFDAIDGVAIRIRLRQPVAWQDAPGTRINRDMGPV